MALFILTVTSVVPKTASKYLKTAPKRPQMQNSHPDAPSLPINTLTSPQIPHFLSPNTPSLFLNTTQKPLNAPFLSLNNPQNPLNAPSLPLNTPSAPPRCP